MNQTHKRNKLRLQIMRKLMSTITYTHMNKTLTPTMTAKETRATRQTEAQTKTDKPTRRASGPKHWRSTMACRFRVSYDQASEGRQTSLRGDIFDIPEVVCMFSTLEPTLNLTSATHFLAGLAFWVVEPQFEHFRGPEPSPCLQT